MRVGARRRQRDRGAVLIIVAVFSFVALLFLAFVIDIGNQRQNRRQLTTATDSAALAVAKEWTIKGLDPTFDCTQTDVDDRLAKSNSPVGNPDPTYECDFQTLESRRGAVTVDSGEVADFTFDGVTGVESGATNSLTTVKIDTVPGGGLRPLALCYLEEQIKEWVDEFEAGGSPPSDQIVFTNDDNECGGSAGNWGLLNLPGMGQGASEWREAVRDGAPESVAVGDWVETQTGVGGLSSATSDFDTLLASSPVFHLPIFQNNPGNEPGGPGNNAMYQIYGFLEVELIAHDLGGSSPSLTIRPLRFDDSGPCCFVNEFNATYEICDVGTTGGEASVGAGDRCLPAIDPPDLPDLDEPDPGGDCEPGLTATLSPSPQRANNSSGNLIDDLGVTVPVADPDDCAGLGLLVLRVDGGATLEPQSCCDLSGSEFSGSFKKSDWDWTTGDYELQVVIGAEILATYDFAVSQG